MAYLTLDSSIGFISWSIRDLSSAFNTNYYTMAGVTMYTFTVSSTTRPSGIMDSLYADSSRNYNSTPYKEFSASAGTHRLWGFTQAKNGTYYPADYSSITVPPSKTKPSYFSCRVYSGDSMMYGYRWNDLTNKINEWLIYKDRDRYNFNTAYSGNIFYAYMYNEAFNSLRQITYVSGGTKSSGDTIYAIDINNLVDAMNNI